jgi:hypothetical protein
MQFYSWLVRKWCEFLDNYSWLVRKWREILDNYSCWALLGGRLPRAHFLDLDRALGNCHFLLQFVFKTDRKPVLVTLGPFGIHLGTGLAFKIQIFAADPL